MDTTSLIKELNADLERLDREQDDLNRQAAVLAQKRERVETERAEINTALTILKRKVAEMSHARTPSNGRRPEMDVLTP